MLFGVLVGGTLLALPGTYAFVEDDRCASHSITLTHEMGVKPPLPDVEAITASAAPVPLPVPCPGAINDRLISDFVITITNLSGIAWRGTTSVLGQARLRFESRIRPRLPGAGSLLVAAIALGALAFARRHGPTR